MTRKRMTRFLASIYRFNDSVAAHVSDDDGTAYLTAAEARALAAALIRCAESVERQAFTDSPSGLGVEITATSRLPNPPRVARRIAERKAEMRARYARESF